MGNPIADLATAGSGAGDFGLQVFGGAINQFTQGLGQLALAAGSGPKLERLDQLAGWEDQAKRDIWSEPLARREQRVNSVEAFDPNTNRSAAEVKEFRDRSLATIEERRGMDEYAMDLFRGNQARAATLAQEMRGTAAAHKQETRVNYDRMMTDIASDGQSILDSAIDNTGKAMASYNQANAQMVDSALEKSMERLMSEGLDQDPQAREMAELRIRGMYNAQLGAQRGELVDAHTKVMTKARTDIMESRRKGHTSGMEALNFAAVNETEAQEAANNLETRANIATAAAATNRAEQFANFMQRTSGQMLDAFMAGQQHAAAIAEHLNGVEAGGAAILADITSVTAGNYRNIEMIGLDILKTIAGNFTEWNIDVPQGSEMVQAIFNKGGSGSKDSGGESIGGIASGAGNVMSGLGSLFGG